jgi:hypothetical protein
MLGIRAWVQTVLFVWLIGYQKTTASTEEVGYSIDKYEESPGIYYENLGEVILFNTEWKTVVYLSLKNMDQESEKIEQYIEHINALCSKTETRNWTDCNHFETIARDKLRQIKGSENLLRELIESDATYRRRRRGLFNFIGEASKVLFGTLDSDDADYYNEQIKRFEENGEDIASLMKQQLSITKAALGTFNETISDMEYNNDLIQKGLNELKAYMERYIKNTEAKLDQISIKINVEGHIARINNALISAQRNLDLVIESILNAQKGILQPQIVSPSLVMETLRKSIQFFPKGTLAPFSLSKDSMSEVNKLCDVHVYLNKGILGYVITLPLVTKNVFKALRLIPLPIAKDNQRFVYIETESAILHVDETRQYYFTTDREELNKCKSAKRVSYICKQTRPLLNSHLRESCVIKLLQPRVTIPKSCDTRIVSIINPVWTKLEDRNEWIYFIPSRDSVTIVCANKEPMEIVISGTGKLTIQAGCKGYTKTALLTTLSEIKINASEKGGDLLSKVDAEFDCCDQLSSRINLSHIDLDMKFKHIVNQVEDLKFASYKISELEKLAREHEWKSKYTGYHTTYSVLAYLFTSIVTIYGIYKLVRFILPYCKRSATLKAIAASTTEQFGLTTEASGRGNIVNINIKTSNESISSLPEDIPLRNLEQNTDLKETGEVRRSRRVRHVKSYF